MQQTLLMTQQQQPKNELSLPIEKAITFQAERLKKFSTLPTLEVKKHLLPAFNEMRYTNEKEKRNQFEGFTDYEMIAYYLYKDTHINSDKVRAEKTLKAYSATLTQFLTDFLHYNVELGFEIDQALMDNQEFSVLRALEPRHIERYTTWLQFNSPYVVLKNTTYSPASLAQKITIIKAFLRKLFEWGYLKAPIYTSFLSVALGREDKPNRDVGPDHVSLLLDIFYQVRHYRLFCFTHFLVTTGIRNTEFCNLRVGNIRKDKFTGTYAMTIIAKGHKEREIPLLPKTVEVIQLYRRLAGLEDFEQVAKTNPNEHVFLTARGKPFTASNLDHFYARELKKLPAEMQQQIEEQFSYTDYENKRDKNSPLVTKQIAITPHAFRHAFAIISKRSGVDVETIKDSLGHNDRKTTEIYLESITRKEQNAVHQWNKDLLGGYL